MTRCLRPFLLCLALTPIAALAEPTVTTSGGVIRVLDKIANTVRDIEMTTGQTEVMGYLAVTMGECRYPSDNPSGDAYAQIVIHDSRAEEPVFSGWMVASAPALNPFDHPRYDVWVLRCSNTEPVLNLSPADEPVEEAPAE